MALFQLKTLDSMVQKASGRIDTALRVDDIAARTESLLTARQENGAAFGQAARRQIYKMAASGALAVAGGLVAAFGIITATSIFAILAGTTGLAIPVAIAGGTAFGIGAASFGISAVNYNRVKRAWQSLNGKIDHAVSSLVKATQGIAQPESQQAKTATGDTGPAV